MHFTKVKEFKSCFRACLCNTFLRKSGGFFEENLFFMRLVWNNSMVMLSCLVNIFLDNVGMDFLWGHGKWISSKNFSLLYNLISSLFSISTQNPILFHFFISLIYLMFNKLYTCYVNFLWKIVAPNRKIRFSIRNP